MNNKKIIRNKFNELMINFINNFNNNNNSLSEIDNINNIKDDELNSDEISESNNPSKKNSKSDIIMNIEILNKNHKSKIGGVNNTKNKPLINNLIKDKENINPNNNNNINLSTPRDKIYKSNTIEKIQYDSNSDNDI